MNEHPNPAQEIDIDDKVYAVAFTANGEHLVGGGSKDVSVWRVKDGEQVATMPVGDDVKCVAVSKDARWIAAGSNDGQVLVWDAKTYKRVLAVRTRPASYIDDVDFSPHSSRLVSANGHNNTVTIWDFRAPQHQVRTLDHHAWAVRAAKYSPQGDRVATATQSGVRVWGSDNGRLLLDIKVRVSARQCLLWSNKHLFVRADDSKIKRIDASTGSTVSEWAVPQSGSFSGIAMPQHGRFVAYSNKDTIELLDASNSTQPSHIRHHYPDIHSIALSGNGQSLAICTKKGKVVLQNLSRIKEPEIPIDCAALDAWIQDALVDAEELLTATISTPQNEAHHALACRALVRARLAQWDAAIDDAKESIKIKPSVIGYIAKCVSLIGMGKTEEGCRSCDIAFEYFHSIQVTLLLLIKAVVLFSAGKHDDAISRIEDLITEVYPDSTFYVVQAHMYLLLGNLHMEKGDYEHAIQSFSDAQARLGGHMDRPPLIISLISGWKFDDLAFTIQQRICEALYASGRIEEASETLLRLANQETDITAPATTWMCDFMQRCLSTQEDSGEASSEACHDIVPMEEGSHALHPLTALLTEWARLRLMAGSWRDALAGAISFRLPRFAIYQAICDRLETTGHVEEAVICFHEIRNEVARELDEEEAKWTRDFISRCGGTLEGIGDGAMNISQFDDAISQYTTALSLNPTVPQHLLAKRSKARAASMEWEDALKDANDVIKFDPSSPLGYERKYEALRGTGYYADAIAAFGTMLSKMSESSDPEMRERSCKYVTPAQTTEAIRATIRDTIHESPVVLIHTTSGRLCDKSEQASAFELMPAFAELVSSMTTEIDYARIKQVVEEYFNYATFSHKWEENEPPFEKVTEILVYDLEQCPTHEKLQMFCKIVRDAGYHWAWSDTCCIDKGNHFVLQEAIVSMFKWYEGSAMTIIFLRGVTRLAQRGALTESIWNKRGWTLQEYHASKVVRFYTEDWTPYLGIDMHNHKESPEIISEMEEATGILAQALVALKPGLVGIREKLRLASTRQTTRVEDAAYSLLGIFSLSLPVLYGEGDKALGRLLAQLLASSGDMSILAWKGRSGAFNSCLPGSITVFKELPTTHIPAPISNAEIQTIGAGLRSLNPTLVTKLHDRLNQLPVPSFSGRRMKLPCLAFKLGQVLPSQNGSGYRAQTGALGIVEIETNEDLSRLPGSLCLVHPWIDFLLDREPVWDVMETVNTPVNWKTRPGRLFPRLGLAGFGGWSASLPPGDLSLSPPSPVEKQIHVSQFLARLRKPFGALLLTQTRRNMDEYRRVAAESLITVQIEELTSKTLNKLINDVRTLDVL